ncbi:MAG: phosphatase PAP2 family protein [Proteobacteria bacterium]|nr:phosphatase PAP2 family protein [Pseudomonadota bacterium]
MRTPATLPLPARRDAPSSILPATGVDWRRQFAWPLLAAAGAILLLNLLHGDTWLADRLYALQGGAWTLRQHPLTEGLVHRGGRLLGLVAWLLVLAAWVASDMRPAWRRWRGPLARLALSVLLSTLLVAVLKRWLQVDCPWDLARYGGQLPWVSLLAPRPGGLPAAHCFPAAHAGIGFAWVALYFCLRSVAPRWRLAGLAAGIGLGAVFGLSQQLRGAHFLSHDIASLVLCWSVAVAVHALWPAARGGATP